VMSGGTRTPGSARSQNTTRSDSVERHTPLPPACGETLSDSDHPGIDLALSLLSTKVRVCLERSQGFSKIGS
jgi:hypothetical protein